MDLKHFICIQDGNVIQSEVVLGLNHFIEVWFLPSCHPDLSISAHLHGFGGLGIHPYGHPLHQKVLKNFMYIFDGSIIQSEVVLGINHVIVVWFVLSCYPK